MLTFIELFLLRVRQPERERPFRVFGYPALPALYILLCGLVMLDLLIVKPLYTLAGAINRAGGHSRLRTLAENQPAGDEVTRCPGTAYSVPSGDEKLF